jgi:hypothetical protein
MYVIQNEKANPAYEIICYDSFTEFLSLNDPRYAEEERFLSYSDFDKFKKLDRKDDWTYGQDLNLENLLKRLESWTPYEDVLEEITKQKAEFHDDPRTKKLLKSITINKKKRHFNTDNGEIDIDRIMAGNPEFFDRKIKTSEKKGIHVLLSLATSASYDAKTFSTKIIELYKLVYIFDFIGVPTRISICNVTNQTTTNSPYRHQSSYFIIKHELEKLNLQKLGLLGCSGLYRCFFFLAKTCFTGKLTGGLGTPIAISDDIKKELSVDYCLSQEDSLKNEIEKIYKTYGV